MTKVRLGSIPVYTPRQAFCLFASSTHHARTDRSFASKNTPSGSAAPRFALLLGVFACLGAVLHSLFNVSVGLFTTVAVIYLARKAWANRPSVRRRRADWADLMRRVRAGEFDGGQA